MLNEKINLSYFIIRNDCFGENDSILDETKENCRTADRYFDMYYVPAKLCKIISSLSTLLKRVEQIIRLPRELIKYPVSTRGLSIYTMQLSGEKIKKINFSFRYRVQVKRLFRIFLAEKIE